jgi:RsmE family RNA methyltransferase
VGVSTAPRVVLAVGPDGGWVPFETKLLEAHGFRPFSLGPRILRVETAVPVLLGQLALLREDATRPA